jgi:hypothetical protein
MTEPEPESICERLAREHDLGHGQGCWYGYDLRRDAALLRAAQRDEGPVGDDEGQVPLSARAEPCGWLRPGAG